MLLCDWSCPRATISDQDAKFTSDFWTGLWRGFGTKLSTTTALHPQADRQAERKNRMVGLAVRFHAQDHDNDWDDVIPALQRDLNNATSTAVDCSPH